MDTEVLLGSLMEVRLEFNILRVIWLFISQDEHRLEEIDREREGGRKQKKKRVKGKGEERLQCEIFHNQSLEHLSC